MESLDGSSSRQDSGWGSPFEDELVAQPLWSTAYLSTVAQHCECAIASRMLPWLSVALWLGKMEKSWLIGRSWDKSLLLQPANQQT